MGYFGEDPDADFKVAGFAALHVLALAAPFYFTWPAFYLWLATHLITGLGITIGYHRLCAHRSFNCPRVVEYFILYMGFLTLAGSPAKWISKHRYHHKHSDTEDDCHSPNRHGFWWSHYANILSEKKLLDDLGIAPELKDNWFYQHLDKDWATWLHGIVIPVIALFAYGGIPFVLWGFGVRIVGTAHIAFSVNSLSHMFGFQDWQTNDGSLNNWLVGLLAVGEGWHNNHHAFPRSCRHGLKAWQIDVSWYVISLWHKLGLAYDLQYPTAAEIREKTPVQIHEKTPDSREDRRPATRADTLRNGHVVKRASGRPPCVSGPPGKRG